MKNISWYAPASLAIALVVLTGCTTTVARVRPTFDYSPPQAAKPASANVTFAVVGANYPEAIPLFQQFGENMSQDFFEILTGRGYTVRGPFRTYDDITFSDKKGADLILIPELTIKPDTSAFQWSPSFAAAMFGRTEYSGEGTVVLTGRVNLVVAESMSREKMWTKSVEIPPLTIRVEETEVYTSPRVTFATLIENENQIYNSVARALEAQYASILESAFKYLDPEEMQLVKKQAQEIRNKKVY